MLGLLIHWLIGCDESFSVVSKELKLWNCSLSCKNFFSEGGVKNTFIQTSTFFSLRNALKTSVIVFDVLVEFTLTSASAEMASKIFRFTLAHTRAC